MRNRFSIFPCLLFMSCTVLILSVSEACAQKTYENARAKFEQLKSNTRSSTVESHHTGHRFTKPDNDRFDIDAVDNFDTNQPPFQCGIAVWFQLENGKYVNPTKHRWNPHEKFYVWIEPAVPVSIGLHQNYIDDQKPSEQKYPDARYPETFRDFPAGVKSKLPVPFRMDDNLIDEIMSMTVVRCDSGTLPIHDGPGVLRDEANVGASGEGAVFKATASQHARFNQEASKKGTINGKNSRFVIVGPDRPDCPEISSNVNDVQFFMFGDGFQHQFQITLKK